MAMQSGNQQPQVIVHVHKHESPWLRRLVLFLLFGWWYVAWAALKWTVTVGWKLCVAYPVKWSIAATRWSIQASKRFHARYGWRGWAIVGAVVIVLAILGNIVGN